MLFLLPALSAALPKVYPGFLWGVNGSQVTISVYADPLCPNCLDLWPTLASLLTKYPTQLGVRIHLVNLPYHTWSYYTVWAIYAAREFGEDKAKLMIEKLFSGDQDLFGNTAMGNVPQSKVPETFADYVQEKLGIDKVAYLSRFNDANVRSLASATFAFASKRGIDGTPTVYLNGVATDMGPDTPMSTWTQIIDELL